MNNHDELKKRKQMRCNQGYHWYPFMNFRGRCTECGQLRDADPFMVIRDAGGEL